MVLTFQTFRSCSLEGLSLGGASITGPLQVQHRDGQPGTFRLCAVVFLPHSLLREAPPQSITLPATQGEAAKAQ